MGRAVVILAVATVIAVANGQYPACKLKNCDPAGAVVQSKGVEPLKTPGKGCTLDKDKQWDPNAEPCKLQCIGDKVTAQKSKTTESRCTHGNQWLPTAPTGNGGTWVIDPCYLPCQENVVMKMTGVKSFKCKDKKSPGDSCPAGSLEAECEDPYELDLAAGGLKCSNTLHDANNWKWTIVSSPCKRLGCKKTDLNKDKSTTHIASINDKDWKKEEETKDAKKYKYIPFGFATNFKCVQGFWAVKKLMCMENGQFNSMEVCDNVCPTNPALTSALYNQPNWDPTKIDLGNGTMQAPTMKCKSNRNYKCESTNVWTGSISTFKSCKVDDLWDATKKIVGNMGNLEGCMVTKSQGYDLNLFGKGTWIAHGEQCVADCNYGRTDESSTGPWCYDGTWLNVDRSGKLERPTSCKPGAKPNANAPVATTRPCLPPDSTTKKPSLSLYTQLLRRCFKADAIYIHGSTVEYICQAPGQMITHPALLECVDSTWMWTKVDGKRTAPSCTAPPQACPELGADLKILNALTGAKAVIEWAASAPADKKNLREVPLSMVKCKGKDLIFHYSGAEPKFTCSSSGANAGDWVYSGTALECNEKCLASGCDIATTKSNLLAPMTKAGLLCDGFCNIFQTLPAPTGAGVKKTEMTNCNGPACSADSCPKSGVTATLNPSEFTISLITDRQVAPSAWVGLYNEATKLAAGTSTGVDEWILAGFVVDLAQNGKGTWEDPAKKDRVKYTIKVDLSTGFKDAAGKAATSWKGKALPDENIRFSELFGKDLKVQFFPDGSNLVPLPAMVRSSDTTVCCDLKDARPAADKTPVKNAFSASVKMLGRERLAAGQELEGPAEGLVEALTYEEVEQEVAEAAREHTKKRSMEVENQSLIPHADVLPAACSSTKCTCAMYGQAGGKRSANVCDAECNNEQCNWDNFKCLDFCDKDNLKKWADANDAKTTETGGCIKNAGGKCMLECKTKGGAKLWGVNENGEAVEGWTAAVCNTKASGSNYFTGKRCRPSCDFSKIYTDLGSPTTIKSDTLQSSCGGNFVSTKYNGTYSFRNTVVNKGPRIAPFTSPYGSICTGAMGWQCSAKATRPKSFANTGANAAQDSTPFGIMCGWDATTNAAKWVFTPATGAPGLWNRVQSATAPAPCVPKSCYVSALKTQIPGLTFKAKNAAAPNADVQSGAIPADPTLVCSKAGDALGDGDTCSYTCKDTKNNVKGWVWSTPQVWTCSVKEAQGGAFWEMSTAKKCTGSVVDTSYECPAATTPVGVAAGPLEMLKDGVCLTASKKNPPEKLKPDTVCKLQCAKNNSPFVDESKMLEGRYSCGLTETCQSGKTFNYPLSTVLRTFGKAEDKGCFANCKCADVLATLNKAATTNLKCEGTDIYFGHGEKISSTKAATGLKCDTTKKVTDAVLDFGYCWDGDVVTQKKTGQTVADLIPASFTKACITPPVVPKKDKCPLDKRPRGAYEPASSARLWNYDGCDKPPTGDAAEGKSYPINCIGTNGNKGKLTNTPDSYTPQAGSTAIKCYGGDLWELTGVDGAPIRDTRDKLEAIVDGYCKMWLCPKTKVIQNSADWTKKIEEFPAASTKEAGWPSWKCDAGYSKRWERQTETSGTVTTFGWWNPGPYCWMNPTTKIAEWKGDAQCVPECGGKGSKDTFSTPLVCDWSNLVNGTSNLQCDKYCVSWSLWGMPGTKGKRIVQTTGKTSEVDMQACSAPICQKAAERPLEGECGAPWVTELRTWVTKSILAWSSERPLTDGSYIEYEDGTANKVKSHWRTDIFDATQPHTSLAYKPLGYPGKQVIKMNQVKTTKVKGVVQWGEVDWGKFNAKIFLDRDPKSATGQSPTLCKDAVCAKPAPAPKPVEPKELSQKCARHGCMCHMLGNGICDPQCYNKDCAADDAAGGEAKDCSCKAEPTIPSPDYWKPVIKCPVAGKTGWVAGVDPREYKGIKWAEEGNDWKVEGAKCTITCPENSELYWNDTKTDHTECRYQEQLKGGYWTQPYCERKCMQPPDNLADYYDITGLDDKAKADAWRDVASRGKSGKAAEWTCKTRKIKTKDVKFSPNPEGAVCRDGKWTELCVATGKAPAGTCDLAKLNKDANAAWAAGGGKWVVPIRIKYKNDVWRQIEKNVGPRTWSLQRIQTWKEADCKGDSVPFGTKCTPATCADSYMPMGSFECDATAKTWKPVAEADSAMFKGEAGCYKWVTCNYKMLKFGEYKCDLALNDKKLYPNMTTCTHDCATGQKAEDAAPGQVDTCTYDMFNPDAGRWYTGDERFTTLSTLTSRVPQLCIPACKDPPRVRGSTHPCIGDKDEAIARGGSCGGWDCEPTHVRDACTSGDPSCVFGGEYSAWNIDLTSAIGDISREETDDFGWPTQRWTNKDPIRNPYCFRPCSWTSLSKKTLDDIDRDQPCEEMTPDNKVLKHGTTCTVRCEKGKVLVPGAMGYERDGGFKPICYNGAFRGPEPVCKDPQDDTVSKCAEGDKNCCAASDLTEIRGERFNLFKCEKDWYAEGETVPVTCPGSSKPSFEAFCSGLTKGMGKSGMQKKGKWAWRSGKEFLPKLPECAAVGSSCRMSIPNAIKLTINGKEQTEKDAAGNLICDAAGDEQCLISCKAGYALEIDTGGGDLKKGPICVGTAFVPAKEHKWCVEECYESSGCLAGKDFKYTPRCDGVCADAIGDYNCAGPSCAAKPDPCTDNSGKLDDISLSSYKVQITTDRPMTSVAWASISDSAEKNDEWLAAASIKAVQGKDYHEANLQFPDTKLGDKTLYVKVFADAGYDSPIVNIAAAGGKVPDDSDTCPGKDEAEKALSDMESARDTWMAVGITFIVLGVLALGFCAFAALQAKNAAGDGGASSTYTAL